MKSESALPQVSRASVERSTWPFLCFLAVWFCSGCDRTAELAKESDAVPAGQLVWADEPAGRILSDTAAAYRKLEKYQDAGRVVLMYEVDGETVSDVAPLSIAFQRPNRLGMRAYMVSVGSEDNRLRVRIGEPQDSPVPGQVVSREAPEKLDLAWLMSDPITSQYLSAGLAGLAPQLELLMGSDPFRGLTERASRIAVVGRGERKGERCTIVAVSHGDQETRLWIQESDRLIRRIELPSQSLPEAMRKDARIRNIRLLIEFDEVDVDKAIDWSKWKVPVTKEDKLVRRFVVPPAIQVDPRLGKTVPAFRLEGAPGEPVADSSSVAGEGKIQILAWSADHPACRSTIEQLQESIRSLPADNAKKIDVGIVWTEPFDAKSQTVSSLKSNWKFTYPVVMDPKAFGRDLFGIQEAPSLVVLDAKHRLQYFQRRANVHLTQVLTTLLPQLVAGNNPASQATEQARVADDRYQAELWLARSSDALIDSFHRPLEYAAEWFELKPIAREVSAQAILAMCDDSQGRTWVLRDDGKLEALGDNCKPVRTVETKWKFATGSQVLLRMDKDEKFVVAGVLHEPKLQLFQFEGGRSFEVNLGDRQELIDVAWLAGPNGSGSQLASITRQGRVVLMDPKQSQSMSGQSAVAPVAILPAQPGQSKSKLDVGVIVLKSGNLEPLVTDEAAQARAKDQVSVQSVSVAKAAESTANAAAPGKLMFTPGAGPWFSWSDPQGVLTLAKGQLASDEPALFMLDSQLRPQWHVPLPLSTNPSWPIVSAARDPVTGKSLWAVVEPQQTIHFLSADGQLVDHCQLDAPIKGLSLISVGSELQMVVAHPSVVSRYQVKLK